MFDDSDHTLQWARRVLDEHVRPAVHRDRRPLQVRSWAPPRAADDQPVPVGEALSAEYRPMEVGQAWGAAWTTTWFELTGTVPEEFTGLPVEVLIDLGFSVDRPGFSAEGLLHDDAGTPLKGIHPRNRWYRVADAAAGGEQIRLYLEAAANPLVLDTFEPTALGDPATAGDEPLYRLGDVQVAVLDEDVFGLAMDLDVLLDLAEQLPPGSARRVQVLDTVSEALDGLDIAGLAAGRSVPVAGVRKVLADALAAPAHASAHQLTAVAHAHIDSAWLWPVRETRRKCARTFANVTNLAQHYPELVFACSSAQQYSWIEQDQPAIWQRITEAVRAGRWEPVGGMWVEPDGMVPSGESLARQLLLGQRFFIEHFGRPCSGMWLPDSFGYNAAYPQIAALGGASWFLTQKISWNDTNTFPHHTFWWEGIDGTRILTHFPPADTYNADLGGADLHRSAGQYRERGRSRKALVPFGYGDGGGGPEREMLERARRLGSVEGSPQVSCGRAESFFEELLAEYGQAAPTWSGELYLELHRGTFTSQRAMKAGNRACEGSLRQAEFVWTLVATTGRGDYPSEHLRDLWERVLLLQFHDILPGSSIAWVHAEARADYRRMLTELDGLISAGLQRLSEQRAVLNSSPFERREVVDLAEGPTLLQLPACSVSVPVPVPPRHPAKVLDDGADGGAVRLGNGLVSVTLAPDGSLSSLIDHRHGDREVLPTGARGVELRLHPDVPLQWDAWDLDKRHARIWSGVEAGTTTVAADGELRVRAETRCRVGDSPMLIRTWLDADSPRVEVEIEIDWRERRKTLAAYLPVAALTRTSRAEIQYGHVERPTHENTSWEAARFEDVGHRWLHVGEAGWGLAVVNDSIYGHSARAGLDADGRRMTGVRLTLLRSATFPDPLQDAGLHRLRFGIVPGADIAEAIEHGYALNLPLVLGPGGEAGHDAREDAGAAAVTRLLSVDDPACVIEAVKLAEDGSGDVIVRAYESLGGRRSVRLRLERDAQQVVETDLLELTDNEQLRRRPALRGHSGRDIELTLEPFQVVTLRIS